MPPVLISDCGSRVQQSAEARYPKYNRGHAARRHASPVHIPDMIPHHLLRLEFGIHGRFLSSSRHVFYCLVPASASHGSEERKAKNDRQVSRSGFNIALCGLKFFYERTLHREWVILDLPRRTREKKLPTVLSVAEVRQILACLRRPYYRVCLTTIYSCGLRLLEGVRLKLQSENPPRPA